MAGKKEVIEEQAVESLDLSPKIDSDAGELSSDEIKVVFPESITFDSLTIREYMNSLG